jgi:signal transduction histidine kinase
VLFAQSEKDPKIIYYKAFIAAQSIDSLPSRIAPLLKNPDRSLLQLCIYHIEKLKRNENNTACEKIYLDVTQSTIYSSMYELKKAVALYEKLELQLRKSTCGSIKLSDIYVKWGSAHNYLGKNDLALEKYYLALKLANKSRDTAVISQVNINIGNVYFTLTQYAKCKEYYLKALNLTSNNKKFFLQEAAALQAMGTLNLSPSSDLNDNISYLNKAIELYAENGEMDGKYTAMNNLGIAYSLQGNYTKAFQLYQEVYEYALKMNNRRLLANVCLDFAYDYSDSGAINEALKFSKESYDNYKAIGMLDGMADATSLLINLYKKQNNFETAYAHTSLFFQYKDSLNQAGGAERLLELKNEYEFGMEREQLNNEVITYKLRSTILIISIVCLLLIIGVVILIRKRQALRAEATRQQQFTFQLLQNTEEERSRIANELHDSVNHDLLTIKNNIINGNSVAETDVAAIIEEVRSISRNLHPAVLETVGLEATIENLCERISEIGLFTTCDIDYTQKLSKNKELQLYRIVQEALNNTLKHGKANAAKVVLQSNVDHLYLEIKDNGSGFDVNQQLKNPKSFGLQSIIQRAKAIAAKLNINSNGSGTVILLRIPL